MAQSQIHPACSKRKGRMKRESSQTLHVRDPDTHDAQLLSWLNGAENVSRSMPDDRRAGCCSRRHAWNRISMFLSSTRPMNATRLLRSLIVFGQTWAWFGETRESRRASHARKDTREASSRGKGNGVRVQSSCITYCAFQYHNSVIINTLILFSEKLHR